MELRQLEYFAAVAEEANFTRAADRVHVSQSGVSAQIRQLERELGASLFDRTGRTATLSPAGVAALEHARATLAAASAVRQAVDDVNGVLRGRLVIGMVTACTVEPLFAGLAAFHRERPAIRISLREDSSDRLVEQVRCGDVDLALAAMAETVPADLAGLPIVSERLVAAAPAGHRLLRRRRVALADLVDHPLVCLPPGTGVRTAFDDSCARRGVRAQVALEASAPGAVLDLARRGLGVAVLSASMVTALTDLETRDLVDADVPAVLALVWRERLNPALRELLTHLRPAFGHP
jgi:DNA-binding transcriptional LysR family regulator